MEGYGINVPFLLAQLVSIGILCGWPILSFAALFRLRGRPLSQTALALWALIVLAVPLLGALAFFILDPRPDGAT